MVAAQVSAPIAAYPDKYKRAFEYGVSKIVLIQPLGRNTCITDGSEKGGMEALAASYKDELHAQREEARR